MPHVELDKYGRCDEERKITHEQTTVKNVNKQVSIMDNEERIRRDDEQTC